MTNRQPGRRHYNNKASAVLKRIGHDWNVFPVGSHEFGLVLEQIEDALVSAYVDGVESVTTRLSGSVMYGGEFIPVDSVRVRALDLLRAKKRPSSRTGATDTLSATPDAATAPSLQSESGLQPCEALKE